MSLLIAINKCRNIFRCSFLYVNFMWGWKRSANLQHWSTESCFFNRPFLQTKFR